MNKKGMTMVEMVVSIALISIVLVLLMNLFINLRSVYNRAKNEADYSVLNSTIINAVADDIENFGLRSIEYKSDESDALVLTFNTYRPTKLSEPISKVLKVYYRSSEKRYYISYSYDSTVTKNLTSTERITSEVRILPEDAVLNNGRLINFTQKRLDDKNQLTEIKIPLSNKHGNIYDINIYGIIKSV